MTLDTEVARVESLSQEKRAQILRGAATVFSEDGYKGASMSQIAYIAGVSKGTLYNHFESKSKLFSEWTSMECDRFLGSVFDLRGVDDDLETTLREIGRRMLALMISPVALLIYRMAVAEAQNFPELAYHFYAIGPARATQMLESWLTQQDAAGRLRISNPDFAAQQFFSLCQTHLVMQRRLGMIEAVTQADADAVVEGATAMFISHYARTTGLVERG